MPRVSRLHARSQSRASPYCGMCRFRPPHLLLSLYCTLDLNIYHVCQPGSSQENQNHFRYLEYTEFNTRAWFHWGLKSRERRDWQHGKASTTLGLEKVLPEPKAGVRHGGFLVGPRDAEGELSAPTPLP